jgi:hypothetical protein
MRTFVFNFIIAMLLGVNICNECNGRNIFFE